MAPFPPQLVELPLLGGLLGFSAALMGLSGADIHDFKQERMFMATGPMPGFVNLEDNGLLTVDIVMLIAGSLSFFFAFLGLVLAFRQFGKRRGEYTGRGTGLWLLLSLVFLTLSGLWAGTASAYTAYTVQKKFSFSAGPDYSEPFTTEQQLYLRTIANDIISGITSQLSRSSSTGAGSISPDYLGEWGMASTLAQANEIPHRYLDYTTKWKAATAVSWITLGNCFLLFVVHTALPFVWKALGLIREPKKPKGYYNEV